MQEKTSFTHDTPLIAEVFSPAREPCELLTVRVFMTVNMRTGVMATLF